jgi:exodeoxyribonuclease VII small subunit
MDKQSSYARTRERLEEIVAQVRAKDISLEKSLDLYEEALRLGSSCAEMIDRTDFSVEELEAVARRDVAEGDEAVGEGAENGDGFDAAAEGDEGVATAATAATAAANDEAAEGAEGINGDDDAEGDDDDAERDDDDADGIDEDAAEADAAEADGRSADER